jgi:hypothetical protein
MTTATATATVTATTASGSHRLHLRPGKFPLVVDHGETYFVAMVGDRRQAAVELMMSARTSFEKRLSINGMRSMGVPNSLATLEPAEPRKGFKMAFVDSKGRVARLTTEIIRVT